MDLLALFGWSFLAATVLPLGSEPALGAIVHRREMVLIPVIIATLGNYLGACTTYALALAARRAMKKPDESPRWKRAVAIIDRYGAPALLLSWVPLIGDAIVAAAGAATMPLLRFSIWTIVGKAARYAAVAAAVSALW